VFFFTPKNSLGKKSGLPGKEFLVPVNLGVEKTRRVKIFTRQKFSYPAIPKSLCPANFFLTQRKYFRRVKKNSSWELD